MSIQNNTAVDVYQNFVLPTALDSDFSSEDLADDMEGLQLTMQRVKIPGGGNLQFEIRGDDPDNPDYLRSLCIQPIRQYGKRQRKSLQKYAADLSAAQRRVSSAAALPAAHKPAPVQ